jgi:outer membrane lipoprotein carrier protein
MALNKMSVATLLTLVTLLAAVAQAAEPLQVAPKDLVCTIEQVVATVEGGYGQLQDLTAHFSQTTTIRSLGREEKASGTMYIRRSSATDPRFRFDYEKPKQLIVSDGTKVWLYQVAERQVIVTDVDKAFSGGTLALSYLTGMGRLSQDFTVAMAGKGRDSKGNYLLELQPKAAVPNVAKLRLTIDHQAVEQFVASGTASTPFPIRSSTVIDHYGTATRLDFTNIAINTGVKDEMFTFRVPAGVEVIRPPSLGGGR